MIIPIRCFTCGKVIAHKLENYLEEIEKHLNDEDYIESTSGLAVNQNSEKTIEGKTLDKLNITNLCCRNHFINYKDYTANIAF